MTENYKQNFALICMAVLYFMMGFVTVLNDTLVPFFKGQFNLSYSRSSLVQFYFYLTYALVSIPAGRWIVKVGYRRGIVWGFTIAGLGAFLFYPAALLHQYGIFLSALFVLAVGIVLLQVSANPYITLLGGQKTAASRLTLIQGVGSVGTTLAPIFGASFILSRVGVAELSGSLIIPYVGIGVVLILFAAVVFKLKLPEKRLEQDVQYIATLSLLKQHPNLRFGICAIFCYVGAEVAIGTFMTNYVADKLEIGEAAANYYVAYYWGGMLIGRLVGAFCLRYVRAEGLLAWLSLLGGMCVVGSLTTEGVLSAWLLVACGLCNSIMFAAIFSLSVEGLGKATPRASGIMATAIVGGAVITYLQGVVKDLYSWEVAFLVPVGCYLCILIFARSVDRMRRLRAVFVK